VEEGDLVYNYVKKQKKDLQSEVSMQASKLH